MKNLSIRLLKPSIGKEELDNIKQVFERGWLGNGPNVSEFENNWSHYIGSKMSIGVNSATAALHLALKAYDFPKGLLINFGAISLQYKLIFNPKFNTKSSIRTD